MTSVWHCASGLPQFAADGGWSECAPPRLKRFTPNGTTVSHRGRSTIVLFLIEANQIRKRMPEFVIKADYPICP